MIRMFVALSITSVLTGAALAAPPAAYPPGATPAAQQQKQAIPGKTAEDEKPDTWTWFGMGFESRRSRMGEDDDLPVTPRGGGSAFGERSAGGSANGR